MASAPAGEAETAKGRLLGKVLEYFAANGIGDASLRQIAGGIGSSHRMLIYHFGSREGLLAAAVEVLEQAERRLLADTLASTGEDPRVLAWRFWTHVADSGEAYGPVYFELASHAMRREDRNGPLGVPNVEMWVDALATMWQEGLGMGVAEARAHARLNLAVARGLLHDLLLTHDRRQVDTAMARWDLLSFGTPHPLPEVRALTTGWGR